jgi:hypothetical protein
MLLSDLKLAPGYSRLPNDGLQGAYTKLGMIRHRNSDRRARQLLLHGNVAATLADFSESMPPEDRADFPS